MILPEKHFDTVILDEATLGQPLPTTILGPALSALRPDGRLLSLMNPGELKHQLLTMLPDGSLFSLEANRFLYEKDLTPSDWDRLYAETPAGACHGKKQTVSRLMTETEYLVRESVANVEAMLERANEMETILLEIYSNLVSIRVKYHLNRWKEALMDYRLGLATAAEVNTAFMKLKSDMIESGDFPTHR